MNIYDIPFFSTSSSGSGSSGALPENVATKDDINLIKAEMQSVSNDIQIMQETVNNVTTSNDEAIAAVNDMKTTVKSVSETVSQLDDRVTSIESELDNAITEDEDINFTSSLFS